MLPLKKVFQGLERVGELCGCPDNDCNLRKVYDPRGTGLVVDYAWVIPEPLKFSVTDPSDR